MFNTKCPYTLLPIADIKSNREHIIPAALGGPNGLALNADAKTNSEFGEGVDSRLINQPLMAMKASAAGVQTRSGPVEVRLQGTLDSDGSPTDIRISEGNVVFRSRNPIVKDPVTGEPIGVRGYGDGAQEQLEKLRAGHARKGRTVLAGEPVAGDSTTSGGFKQNLAEDTQGIAKIAYLTAVWTLGDAFIDTEAAAAFRKLIFGVATTDAFRASGVMGDFIHGSEERLMPPSPTEHHLVCAFFQGHLFIEVSLFGELLFTRRFIVPLTLAGVGQLSKAIVVNAKTKTFEQLDLDLPSQEA